MALNTVPPGQPLSQLPTKRVSGIYFLWRGTEIVYVGKSIHITERIAQHLGEGRKAFSEVSFIRCRPCQLASREREYIEGLLPRYNSCNITVSMKRLVAHGMAKPRLLPIIPSGKGMAERLGLTNNQFDWLKKQPGFPKRIRIPRANVRRYSARQMQHWLMSNEHLLDQAKSI